jgi:hypothetical protein
VEQQHCFAAKWQNMHVMHATQRAEGAGNGWSRF